VLMNGYEWTQDCSLPEGWKIGKSQHKQKIERKLFCSPKGEVFGKRSEVMKHMVEQNYPETDIKMMRKSFLEDGWKPQNVGHLSSGKSTPLNIIKSDYLPEGWMYRNYPGRSPYNHVRTKEGKVLTSFRSIESYLRTEENYTEEDLDRFYLFPDGIVSNKKRGADPSWMKSEFLPEGWKYRDPLSKGHSVNIMSTEGKIFLSFKSVSTFFQTSDNHSEEDEKRLASFHQEFSKLEMNGKNILTRKNNFDKLIKKEDNDDAWMEDPMLPAGWKVRQRPGHAYSILEFKTSEGELVDSFKKALGILNDLGIDCTKEMKKLKKKFSKPRVDKPSKSNKSEGEHEVKQEIQDDEVKTENCEESETESIDGDEIADIEEFKSEYDDTNFINDLLGEDDEEQQIKEVTLNDDNLDQDNLDQDIDNAIVDDGENLDEYESSLELEEYNDEDYISDELDDTSYGSNEEDL